MLQSITWAGLVWHAQGRWGIVLGRVVGWPLRKDHPGKLDMTLKDGRPVKSG